MKEEKQIYKMLPQSFYFLSQDWFSYGFSKLWVIILPRFYDFERP